MGKTFIILSAISRFLDSWVQILMGPFYLFSAPATLGRRRRRHDRMKFSGRLRVPQILGAHAHRHRLHPEHLYVGHNVLLRRVLSMDLPWSSISTVANLYTTRVVRIHIRH